MKEMKTLTIGENTYEVVDGVARKGITNKVDAFDEKAENIFTTENLTVDAYLSAVGNHTDATNYCYTDYLEVVPNSTYRLTYHKSVPTKYLGCCYDANKTFLSAISGVLDESGTYYTFSVSSECKYIRVNWRKADVDTCEVIAEAQSLGHNGLYSDEVVNLFNLYDEDVITEKQIKADGTLADNVRYGVSGYIPIKTGVKYMFPIYYDSLSGSTSVPVFDENKNYLASATGTVNTTTKLLSITFTQGAYIRVNFLHNTNYRNVLLVPYQLKHNFMVIEGEYPLNSYYKYGEKYNLKNADIYNPLWRKSAFFVGDSLCHGSSAADSEDAVWGWAGRIGTKNRMLWLNRGFNGNVITSGLKSLGEPCISECNVFDGADYIILEGGVNDADLIGDILDDSNLPEAFGSYNMTDFTSEFDNTTFCGAVEYLLKRVTSTYKGAKIGFIIAHKQGTLNNQRPDFLPEHNNRRKYYETIITLCKKWGVPVLNLWDGCYLNPQNPSHYTNGQTLMYTDGQHLASAGYDYVASVIESWMRTL